MENVSLKSSHVVSDDETVTLTTDISVTSTATKTINHRIKGLDVALEKVQFRSRTRKLSAREVSDLLDKLQLELNEILFKKDQVGIKVRLTVFTKVAASYNGRPQATFVELEKGKTNWKLHRAYRDNAISGEVEVLNLADFKDKIMKKLASRFNRTYFVD